MTIAEALEICDEVRPNDVSAALKIAWLSELDRRIFDEVLKTRTAVSFAGYNVQTLLSTELLAENGYGNLYISYLIMNIDLMNGEIHRYNNSSALFDSLFYEFGCYCSRDKKSQKQTRIKAGKLYD